MRFNQGVRIVALFEAAKGLLVLLAGFGLLSLVHQNVQQAAVDLVEHLHIDPMRRYPKIFLVLAANISDTQLWLLASLSFAYTAIRLIEAYGLWQHRRWAEWLAAVSGIIYIPFELYELSTGISWIKVCTLSVNIYIVIYMLYLLKRESSS
jgi:uncharacterized membrane protein (DUF2068 family)